MNGAKITVLNGMIIMKSNVINFRLSERPNKLRAMGFLVNNINSWPNLDDTFVHFFHGWRFFRIDGEVIFCDFIHPCIYEGEFLAHMQLISTVRK